MNTRSYAIRDSMTMLRRQFKHVQRYPSVTLLVLGVPIILLLLFVYVFGDTMGAGLAGAEGGRSDYANYLVPGILVMAVAGAVQGTAIAVAMDMTEGIIARFRTMAIARVSVLTGHVLGSLIQTMLGLAVVVGVALGLLPKPVGGASTLPMPLILLPFLGSGFVPTDSMPAGLRWFAENQPFTPVIETLRGLLLGTEIGNSGVLAVAWSVGIALVSYIWAKRLYNRDPSATGRSLMKVSGA